MAATRLAPPQPVTYDHDAEGSWLVVFAANLQRLPMSSFDDVAGMQAALQPLLPDVEVERIVGWDWADDPLALGTWCIYRPGQLARVLPDPRSTEGRLFFAGADSAIAWRSFIDGAIQSGYRAARDIDLPHPGRRPGLIHGRSQACGCQKLALPEMECR